MRDCDVRQEYGPALLDTASGYGTGYGTALVLSLFEYAEHDAYFEKALITQIQKLDIPIDTADNETFFIFSEKQGGKKKASYELLMPFDRTDAKRRAEWLIARIRAYELPDTHSTKQLLSSWVKKRTKEAPKAIVIGFIIGVVPPIGVGHLNRKKKMSLILERGITQDTKRMVKYTAEASLGMLVEALKRTGGRTDKLEPEMSDWFFGERAIGFYTTDHQTLRLIEKELKELSVVHHAVVEDGRITALAISPAVNSSAQEEHWNIDTLELSYSSPHLSVTCRY